MIPGNTLSTSPQPADFVPPDDRYPVTSKEGTPIDWELGGIALNDPSEGFLVQVWEFTITGGNVTVGVEGSLDPPEILIPAARVTEISGSFDSAMNPILAYVQDEEVKLRWYNPDVTGYATTAFPGYRTPRLTLDDKRPNHDTDRDVLLFAMKGDTLVYRQQRDKYGTERALSTDTTYFELGRVGMNRGNRVQIEVFPTDPYVPLGACVECE